MVEGDGLGRVWGLVEMMSVVVDCLWKIVVGVSERRRHDGKGGRRDVRELTLG